MVEGKRRSRWVDSLRAQYGLSPQSRPEEVEKVVMELLGSNTGSDWGHNTQIMWFFG
ncbi:hypothetical protein ACFLZP_04065 [Patescibacteria group bacterium]